MKSHLILASLLMLAPVGLRADLASAATALGGEATATGLVTIKNNKTLDAAALVTLASDPQLTGLTMHGCKMTSEAVAAIAKSRSLKSLDLGHSMVNKIPDLQVLAQAPALETLNLGGSDFGDDGLKALSELKTVKTLLLGHVGRNDRTAYSADGLKVLATLPKLDTLMLHIHRFDPAMLDALKSLKSLKTLTIGGLTEEQFNTVKTGLPGVTLKARGKFVED